MTTLAVMLADLASYTQYSDAGFVAQFPRFISSSEERCWFFIQVPAFKKQASPVLSLTISSPYVTYPTDFLAPASFAVISALGVYSFLLNKDVNFIREAFPDPAATGTPTHYAIFDQTKFIVGPTPAAALTTELDYFYKPASLNTDTAGTWLSINAYDTLLYGALSESASWLKKTSGIDVMGDEYEKRFIVGLQGLKNLGEARDRKDTYRGGEKRTAEQ